jgi:hypothetical protein
MGNSLNVTVERKLTDFRRETTSSTGVCPRGAKPRPRGSLVLKQVSSPQWISAPSRLARTAMAG